MGEVHVGDLEFRTLLWSHIYASMDTAVLKCAVKLRLFDAMHAHGAERGIVLSDLAASLSVPPNREILLRRILRYLSHMRLVTIHREAPDAEEAEETYALTPTASTHLIEASEKSHSAFLQFVFNSKWLSILPNLDTCLQQQETSDCRTFFGRFEKNPELGKTFNDAMGCTARSIAEAVVRGCPKVFEGVRTLVDVGGGNGIVASAIARAFPSIKCTVYDLDFVLADAPLHNGIRYQAGDMFLSVPQADALLLTRVLHDWNDEKATEILKRCREAIIEENGKLIIVDMVLNENDNEDMQCIKLSRDILMLVTTDGRERTKKEWRSLLLQAGFSRCNFNQVVTFEHVIEARP